MNMNTPDTASDSDSTSPPKVAPESLELRARPRRVTRLNPKALAVLAGGLAAAVLGAMLWSLQPQQRRQSSSPDELYNVERITRSEALERLPTDYSQIPPPAVPQLGPPLPGDLGVAMLKAEQQTPLPADPLARSEYADAERLNRLKEAEAAALSPVFFRSVGSGNTSGSDQGQTSPDDLGLSTTALAQRQDHNEAFATRSANTQIRNAGFVQMPESPYQVMAGTIIAAALVTGIKSDLPGEVIATVTEPVYDSATGDHLLIPQGSRLLGRYNSQVDYGQRRVQVFWQRVIFPDTSSIQLDNLVGTDAAGYSGLEDSVDWHWDRIVAGAAMSSMLGIGAELAAPQSRSDSDRVIIAGRDGLQDTVNQVGQQMTQRNLDIKPTLTQRPGLPLRVIVNRDMVLHPFPEAFGERTDPPLTEGNVR